jgi:endoglucanase
MQRSIHQRIVLGSVSRHRAHGIGYGMRIQVSRNYSAQKLIAKMKGWNVGNTLDAIPDEGSWNNPPVTPAIFDDIKNAGFKSVRIPS